MCFPENSWARGVSAASTAVAYTHLENVDLNKLVGTSDMKKIKDLKGNPLLLFVNSWSIGMVLDRNEGLQLEEFGRN